MVDMMTAFRRSDAWLLYCDRGSKRPHMFEIWFMASPSFIWGPFDFRMVHPVKDVIRMHERFAPEISTKRAAIEEASYHISICPMWAFAYTVL